MGMDFLHRLQVAAQLADVVESQEDLPDARTVAAQCSSWGVTALLKPHQAEGVAWLIKRYVRGVNVILGDEMGLGKTLQAITLLSYLKFRRHCHGPFLVICPLSVTDGWATEFAQFTPKLQIIRYIGDKEQRDAMRKSICEHVNQQQTRFRDDPTLPFHVILTTNELVIADVAFLSRFQWRYMVFDEAQRLKNFSSVLYKTLEEQYMVPRRLLLTGTPVQNNLSELWALLHFCLPLVFNDLEGFLCTFQFAAKATQCMPASNLENRKRLEILRCILYVFMLRRTKAALVQNKALVLPPVSEVIIMASLVQVQRKVYVSVLKKELPKLVQIIKSGGPRLSMQNTVMQLRKACSHPYLFDGVEPEPFVEGEHLVQASGKLLVLDALLKNLFLQRHRVLIYAQMARTLDILQDYLEFRGYSYERLDGSVRAEERFAAVRSFNATELRRNDVTSAARDREELGKAFVFLLTTRAGGVGLNLIAADTVIFYEQDWNPQADKQALQRAHRIGQLNPVLAINIVTENTVEEVILRRAKRKLQLTRDVIGCDEADLEAHGPGSVSSSELTSMIIFGLQNLDPSDSQLGDDRSADKEVMTKIDAMVNTALEQRGKIEIDGGISVSEEDLMENIYRFDGRDFSVSKQKMEVDTDSLESSDEGVLDSWIKKIDKHDRPSDLDSRRGRKLAVESTNDIRHEEIRAEKERKSAERKNAKWKTLGYKSLAVADPGDIASNLSTDVDAGDVHFVFGDCTKPVKLQPLEVSIILSFIDNSGIWGHGGMFSALDQLSMEVCHSYVAAHAASDLHLGDLHLIEVSDGQNMDLDISQRMQPSEDERCHSLWVGLAVVQTYDHRRKVPRSDVSLTALETCLQKVASSAVRMSASIHMPRVGSHPKQDRKEWYAVERLLRKYATTYGVHFFVYYFKRAKMD